MTQRGAGRAGQQGGGGSLALILFIQAIERAAWNGLAPQLPEMARTLGASEGRAAFYLSIFLLVTYVAAYPLARLTDKYLRPGWWCCIGLVLLSIGYLLLGLRWVVPAAALLPIGFAFSRLGIGLSVTSLDAKKQPSWWLIHLAVNIGAACGGWLAQQIAWRAGLPAVCRACALATLLASLLCILLRSPRAAEAPKDGPTDHCMVAARWWAVRCICLLTIGTWVAALQPLTTMVLFAGRASPWLGPIHLGVGSYASLHAGQVILVVCVALALRQTSASVLASVWAMLISAAGFAVLAGAALLTPPLSPLWLISVYALLSIAEPYLFVAGVRNIERLAPAGYHGRAFGAWYGSVGLGLFAGSLFGLCWDRLEASAYFALLALALIGNAALLSRVAGRLDGLVRRFG